MSNKRTLKALEELVKTEHMAVAALESALEGVEDNKTRRQYRKWRDSHVKQADALNDRLEELGGEPVAYELGSGKGQATLWGKITGLRDDTSVAGMRIGAERGIKRYIDHLDEIDDAKALNVVRKNLEAKQDEIEWYDDQSNRERSRNLETKFEATDQKAKELAAQASGGKGRGFPFPLLIIAVIAIALALIFMRRGEEMDYDDYGEDAFRYEGEGESPTSESSSSSSGLGSQGNGAGSDYLSNSGDVTSAG
jgi:hypothetical protein